MRDRQVFETETLANGMRVYSYPMDVPFSNMGIVVPVGSGHNTDGVAPGTAHALEHMALERSKRFPGKEEYDRLISLQGGEVNAFTGSQSTVFLAETGADFGIAWEGLCSHVFEPLLLEEDLVTQKGIIASERRRWGKWYPSRDELGHHLWTKWKFDVPTPLRQSLGDEPDIAGFTVADLRDFQRRYASPRTYALIGGNVDAARARALLETIPTTPADWPSAIEPARWAEREYHEKDIEDIERFEYYRGGFVVPAPDVETRVALNFIGVFLTDYTHGPLYQWLRKETGWLYEVSYHSYGDHRHFGWHLRFPLPSKTEVTAVRAALEGKILAALRDEQWVAREVNRRLGRSRFNYQTLGSILESAADDLETYGRIWSEAETHAALERCRDTKRLEDLYHTYFTGPDVGEVCFYPRGLKT